MRLSFICPCSIYKISISQKANTNSGARYPSLAEVDGVDGEGERPAPIDPLELPRAVVVLVEFLHHVRSDFVGRFLAIDLAEGSLGAIEHVDALDHLAGVFLEQEDEEFMRTALDDVGESFSLFSVELAWEDDVGDGIDHLLLVGLTSERVLSVLGLDFNLFVATAFSLALSHEDTCTLTTTLTPALINHALWCLEWTQRFLPFPFAICLIVIIPWLLVRGRTGLWIGMIR